ncbi:MAG: hypothetical protein HQK86_01705 [Nitrospinae bacterium]|nr:hypothetical protein [Nitrospinota bacterium]MBF0633684.1 hypothetical protein [Nitrospinota bacterium]
MRLSFQDCRAKHGHEPLAEDKTDNCGYISFIAKETRWDNLGEKPFCHPCPNISHSISEEGDVPHNQWLNRAFSVISFSYKYKTMSPWEV